jgi:hypothetical protein
LLSAEDVSAEQWADFDEHGYVKLELYVCMYVCMYVVVDLSQSS